MKVKNIGGVMFISMGGKVFSTAVDSVCWHMKGAICVRDEVAMDDSDFVPFQGEIVNEFCESCNVEEEIVMEDRF